MKVPWLHTAIGEIGVKEAVRGDNPRILEYHRATTLGAREDVVPWCSAFACWCMHGGGAFVVPPDGIASPRSARARDWLPWGVEVEPCVGAVVVMRRGGNPVQGHVGFLLDWRDHFVTVIGGNQHDRVSVETFMDTRVLGYRMPKVA
jgi:uncharacterized protein (TIGR02594 family)